MTKVIQLSEAPENVQKAGKFFHDILFSKIPCGFWVAGGAVRKAVNNEWWLDSDIDIYTSTDDNRKTIIQYLLSIGGKIDMESDCATNIRVGDNDFDVVRTLYQSPVHTVLDFDFTVCAAAFIDGLFICHDNFFEDCKAKRIRLLKPRREFILSRFQKYVSKGYFATNEDLVGIHKCISGGGWFTEIFGTFKTSATHPSTIRPITTATGEVLNTQN